MIYVLAIFLGMIGVFATGFYFGAEHGAAAKKKLARIKLEINSVPQTIGYEAQRFVDNVKKHL